MFNTGSLKWPGISKLVEECGEVLQVCGKLIRMRGDVIHFDGSNLRDLLEDEIGDVLAACLFVVRRCELNGEKVVARMTEKLALFERWHIDEAEDPPPQQCPTGGRHGEYEFCPHCDCGGGR